MGCLFAKVEYTSINISDIINRTAVIHSVKKSFTITYWFICGHFKNENFLLGPLGVLGPWILANCSDSNKKNLLHPLLTLKRLKDFFYYKKINKIKAFGQMLFKKNLNSK